MNVCVKGTPSKQKQQQIASHIHSLLVFHAPFSSPPPQYTHAHRALFGNVEMFRDEQVIFETDSENEGN